MKIIIQIAIAILLVIPRVTASQERYELPCRSDLLIKSEQIALGEMGKSEHNNRAKHCDDYNRSAGTSMGSPYCTSGPYWTYVQACKILNLDKSYIPFVKTALAANVFFYAKKNGKKSKEAVAKHDFVVWKKGNTIFGHIERVKSIIGNGWVETYAFNTGGTDPREGDVNAIKRRNLRAPLGRMQIRGFVGFEAK